YSRRRAIAPACGASFPPASAPSCVSSTTAPAAGTSCGSADVLTATASDSAADRGRRGPTAASRAGRSAGRARRPGRRMPRRLPRREQQLEGEDEVEHVEVADDAGGRLEDLADEDGAVDGGAQRCERVDRLRLVHVVKTAQLRRLAVQREREGVGRRLVPEPLVLEEAVDRVETEA